MLAGVEKALCARSHGKVKAGMSAIDSLLTGLIDYAGLYPPAGLEMRAAAQNYLNYSRSPHGEALGRFVVDLYRFPELLEAAGDSIGSIRLSLIATTDTDWSRLQRLLGDGHRIEAIEIKTAAPVVIERIAKRIPSGPMLYVEVPMHEQSEELLDVAVAVGARIKLRMGGMTAENIPTTKTVADMLKALAVRHISFKATAGLHHPLRSRHPLTGDSASPLGMMHGFVNLACASALVYFGGEADEARRLLDEEDCEAWRITPDSIVWSSYHWSAAQLSTVRSEFMISFGSCSFVEPIRDLEALGWL